MIPVTEVEAYCRMFHVEHAEQFLGVICELDYVWFDLVSAKAKNPGDGSGAAKHHRTGNRGGKRG